MIPKFNDLALLTTALTHRSALNESASGTPSKASNERLEFLGDAVLELAITLFLFGKLPNEPEGMLTAFRSALVKTETLAEVASELGLGQKLYLSKGEEATGGRTNVSLLANTTEAVIGAIYLDQGFEAAQAFVQTNIVPKFDEIQNKRLYKDAKSLLQETAQAQGYPTPHYAVIDEEGPDHQKIYTVKAVVGDKDCGHGQGANKQAAQQAAATQALLEFEKKE